MGQDNGKRFWSVVAGFYEKIIHKDYQAYKRMYALIRPCVKNKTVLELATGTGLIARNISSDAGHVDATDFSDEMISQAKKLAHADNLHFEVQDACSLSYNSQQYDVVIISNALHIMPNPEKALAEIHRVMRDDGILIAPTFTHANLRGIPKLSAGIMKLFGFPIGHAWSPDSYLEFLNKNGFSVRRYEVLKTSFPLTYTECLKK